MGILGPFWAIFGPFLGHFWGATLGWLQFWGHFWVSPNSAILANLGGVSPTPETVYVFKIVLFWGDFQKRTQSLGWVQPWVGTHGFEGVLGPFLAFGQFWAIFGGFLGQKWGATLGWDHFGAYFGSKTGVFEPKSTLFWFRFFGGAKKSSKIGVGFSAGVWPFLGNFGLENGLVFWRSVQKSVQK